jgi:hypothetical protein
MEPLVHVHEKRQQQPTMTEIDLAGYAVHESVELIPLTDSALFAPALPSPPASRLKTAIAAIVRRRRHLLIP